MKFDPKKIKQGHEYDKKTRDIVDRGKLRITDIIAPDAIENDVNHLKVGSRYIRTVIITGYPRTAHIGWLNRLYAYGANIDITSHIEPLPSDKVIKSLNKKIAQYISTQRMDAMKGKITDIAVETARADAEELRDSLHKGKEKLYYQAIYINIAGSDIDDMDLITEEIETLCGSIGLTTRHAMFQQSQGFRSVLPIAEDRLRYRRNFDTSSLATCLPIVSAELTSTKGTPILYGLNMINGSLVMFDRFSLPNHNSITLATSGAGKSYQVKLEAIRYLALGTNVMIIDPQGEYARLAEHLGGQYVRLASNSNDRINPLDLEFTQEEESGRNFLTQKVLDVLSIVEVMIKRPLTARERKIILDAIEETYQKYGISRERKSIMNDDFIEGDTFKLEGSKKQMPTLNDLDQQLRSKGEEGIRVADELEPYTHGVLNLFSGESTINPNSKFIVFDIKDMEKELAELAMFIVLEFIWNKVKSGDSKKRLVIVDEAWMLMTHKQSADYVIRVAKTARKFNAGLSIISQQAKDFLANGGEGVVGNTSMQVLLRQSQSDLKTVSEMFGLSKNEQGFLKTANPGEALIFANGNHTAVQVVSHPFEHLLCTTTQEELEKIQNLLKD